jgi:signal transduction histidine kinase
VVCAILVAVPVAVTPWPLRAFPAAVTAALAVAAALLPWPVRIPKGPLRRLQLPGGAAVVAAVSLLVDGIGPGPLAAVAAWYPVETAGLLVLLGLVLRQATARKAVGAGCLLGAAVVLLPLRALRLVVETDWVDVVGLIVIAALPVGAVTGVGLYLRALDTRRARAVTEARRRQRLAVARDLHDFVAHEMTGILLAAQAGQLQPDSDSAQHRDLLGRIEQAALRGLDSLDHTLHTLRAEEEGSADDGADGASPGEEPPTRTRGTADLPELVERFGADGPIDARWEVDAPPAVAASVLPALPVPADAALYRVALEALTNVRRHAPRAEGVVVRLAVAGHPARVELSVTDTGGGAARIRLRSPRGSGAGGTGLLELRERVAALGGSLETGRSGAGWRVRVSFPVEEAAGRIAG